MRYYQPRAPTHEASVLCSHLARFVQEALDVYARRHPDFPPQSPSQKPRAVLLITDRTMDLMSPLVHEFTYQAMALDLLDIKDSEKTTYKTVSAKGQRKEEVKEVELGEADTIWTAYRHMHMKDLLPKLTGDFKKFRDANPQFNEKYSFWHLHFAASVDFSSPEMMVQPSALTPSRTNSPACRSFPNRRRCFQCIST